jgi:hypothetical protein
MNYFPHNPLKHAASAANALAAVRQSLSRDILWNKPVFKAPGLPNPAIALDPLPLPATRLFRRSVQG